MLVEFPGKRNGHTHIVQKRKCCQTAAEIENDGGSWVQLDDFVRNGIPATTPDPEPVPLRKRTIDNDRCVSRCGEGCRHFSEDRLVLHDQTILDLFENLLWPEKKTPLKQATTNNTWLARENSNKSSFERWLSRMDLPNKVINQT